MRKLRMWIVVWLCVVCCQGFAADPVADKKATDAKPPTAKSTTPVTEDFLAGLPTVVALPAIDDKLKPVSLGKTTVPANAILAVALLGGEIGTKAKPRSVALLTKGEEFVARAWDIQLVSPRANDERVTVAHLEIQNQQLMFNWTPAAANEPQALLFANCVFSLSAGRTQKKISFRKTVKGEPLPLNLNEDTSVKWEIPAAPDASRIKVEFKLTSRLPRHRFLGSSILKASGEETWMEFIEKDIAGALQIKIECKMKNQLELKATPFLVILDKKMEVNAANIKRWEMQLQQTGKGLEQQISLAADLAKSQPKNTNIATGKAQLEKQLKMVNASRDKLSAVREFVEQTKELQPLQVRAFIEVENVLVDLMSSSVK